MELTQTKSNMFFFLRRGRGGGGTGVPGETLFVAEKRTNKINPHMKQSLGTESRPHWWEASALTTAQPLLPD